MSVDFRDLDIALFVHIVAPRGGEHEERRAIAGALNGPGI